MEGFQARAGAAVVAGVLAAIGTGFAVAAIYLGFREVLNRPLAAAATAGCLFLAAAVVQLATRRRPRKAAPGTAPSLLAGLPLVDLVRGKPALSVLAALGAGALLEQLERRRR